MEIQFLDGTYKIRVQVEDVAACNRSAVSSPNMDLEIDTASIINIPVMLSELDAPESSFML